MARSAPIRTSGASVCGSVTAQGGQIADGLDEIRLAASVRADEDRGAGLKGEFDARPAAEVHERQVTDVHERATGSAGQPHRHDQVGVVAVELSGIARRYRAQHYRFVRRGEHQPGGWRR